jgi:Raf kinase inhibitor-like YbhB/YbcL family protein
MLKEGRKMIFRLFSTSFEYGDPIPLEHTCEGADLSPDLKWENLPPGTESLVLIMDDPDAPSGTWVHWVLYDIPGRLLEIGKGDTAGTCGRNSWGNEGYGGPCPPPGHGVHRYFFKIYALDTITLDLPPGAAAGAVKAAFNGHVLAVAEYMGTFERK